MQSPRQRVALAALLAMILATRSLAPGQPIVENYVGRQVPTAMVARNLDRGSGFLRPSLDTAPLPNLFLVEPPIFAAAAVGLHRVSGLPLEPSGRIVSALATALGAWGLFGLARRREGEAVALAAVAAWGAFPILVRYGRAFQPDAMMLGVWLAGMRLWDEGEAEGSRARVGAGWALVATGLALKVTSAYLVVPLGLCVARRGRAGLALIAAAFLPALLWYAHAASLIDSGGSSASADSRAIWLGALVPSALLRPATYAHAARFLVVRGFTPVGFALGAAGIAMRGCDRVWRIWAISAGATLAALAAKVHHEYYWMAAAPALAVGVGRASVGAWRAGGVWRAAGVAAGSAFVGLAAYQSSSTFRTPPEWAALAGSAREVDRVVPQSAWLVASEALLYAADRRGCRWEPTDAAARRAAGEWGPAGAVVNDPVGLVDFYRSRGARYFADLDGPAVDPGRRARLDIIRRRYAARVDRPGLLLVDLGTEANGEGSHGDHHDPR